MEEIKLTQGKVALVDDEDFERLNKYKWCCHHGYAVRSEWRKDKKGYRTVLMHREIMHTPPGLETDHKDRDKLNNQKANLRVCTHAQNMVNANKHKGSSSKFRGVSAHRRNKKYTNYRAELVFNGKSIVRLFPFTPEGEIQAALKYNELAKLHHGEFAQLNTIK
jgi:hypothetical protein